MDSVSHHKAETHESCYHKLDGFTHRFVDRARRYAQDTAAMDSVSKHLTASCTRCTGGRGYPFFSPLRDRLDRCTSGDGEKLGGEAVCARRFVHQPAVGKEPFFIACQKSVAENARDNNRLGDGTNLR